MFYRSKKTWSTSGKSQRWDVLKLNATRSYRPVQMLFFVLGTFFTALYSLALVSCGSDDSGIPSEKYQLKESPPHRLSKKKSLPKGTDASVMNAPSSRAVKMPVTLEDHINALDAVLPSQRKQAIRQLWILAADTGVPDKALAALGALADYENVPQLEQLARKAIIDLRNVKKEFAVNVVRKIEQVEDYDTEFENGQESMTQKNTKSAGMKREQFEALKEQALWAPEKKNRYAAIKTLAFHRNSPVIDTLIESAMNDSDAGNRLKAIKTLWFAGADRPDERDRILECFDKTLYDENEKVVKITKKAISDLHRLNALHLAN